MVDFILHFLSSALLYVILRALNINTTKALLITILIGVLKELFDLYAQKETISLIDIVYDIIGTFTALILCIKIKQKT